jgi:hypothetical protein
MLEIPTDFSIMFPIHGNVYLANLYGVSKPTIQRWAKMCGCKKDQNLLRERKSLAGMGKVVSTETRLKMSQKAKGRKLSSGTVNKIIATKMKNGTIKKGCSHYRWKGGRSWERFKNPQYQEWRNAVLARDNYTCTSCTRQCKKYEKGLAAHHIKNYADHPELRYDVSNGITMCRKCHMELHKRSIKDVEKIPCKCGCGTMIDSFDCYGRPRLYVNHHASKGRKCSDVSIAKMRETKKGKKLTEEHRRKISMSLRSSKKKIGRPKKQHIYS